MPYASVSDLPPAVRDRYSPKCRETFRATWNAAYTRNRDEGSAFAIAHAAARKCMSAGKAEWDSAYIADLPDSAFACREERKYPHHNSSGALDLPHLRNALSRVNQEATSSCGKAHLLMHARIEGIGDH